MSEAGLLVVCGYAPCDEPVAQGREHYCSEACALKTHRHFPLSGWEKIPPDPRDVRIAQVRRGQRKKRGTCGKCANTIVGDAGTCARGGRYACDARGCAGCSCCFRDFHSKGANGVSKDC